MCGVIGCNYVCFVVGLGKWVFLKDCFGGWSIFLVDVVNVLRKLDERDGGVWWDRIFDF